MALSHNQGLQRIFGGGFFERLFLKLLSSVQMFLLSTHKEKEALQLLRKVRRERRSVLTAYENYTIYSIAKSYADKPGAMAEVGVFQGASARLICETKGDKSLHLFDTFEGLPKGSEPDGIVHDVGMYACDIESVRGYLEGYANLHFHKGLFPASAADVEEAQFCFVHFDVDLYESTRACVEYFYDRMIPGGVMISHDYSLLAGVRKAIDEFLADKPENTIQLPSTQCMIIKL